MGVKRLSCSLSNKYSDILNKLERNTGNTDLKIMHVPMKNFKKVPKRRMTTGISSNFASILTKLEQKIG